MASGLFPDFSLDSESRHPAGTALHRVTVLCGAAMRGAEGVAATAAAILGAVPPVSPAWLGPAIAVNLAWSGLFMWAVLRYGPRTWLVTIEIAITVAFCLAQGRLVVPEAAQGGTSWIAVLATMTIVMAALAWTPRAAVPAGLVVAGAHLAGAYLAGSGAGLPTAGIHLVQITAMAVLTSLLRRSAALADVSLGGLRQAATAAAVLRARRADEREQYSRVHDTVLNTLTMIGTGGVMTTSPVLREQATADLAELEHIAAAAAVPQHEPVPLDARLEAVAAQSGLRVTTELGRGTVPGHVAEAFAGAAAEALTNVARHAGVRAARLRSARSGGEIRVEIADAGRGFDPAGVPPHRYGLRGSIGRRMESVGGGARVESGDGGTRVTLWWRP